MKKFLSINSVVLKDIFELIFTITYICIFVPKDRFLNCLTYTIINLNKSDIPWYSMIDASLMTLFGILGFALIILFVIDFIIIKNRYINESFYDSKYITDEEIKNIKSLRERKPQKWNSKNILTNKLN